MLITSIRCSYVGSDYFRFEKSWVVVFRLDWNENHLENFLKTANPDKFSKNSWKWWPGMWIFEKVQWNSNAGVENLERSSITLCWPEALTYSYLGIMKCGWKRRKALTKLRFFLVIPLVYTALYSLKSSNVLFICYILFHFSAKCPCEDGRKKVIILILRMNGESHAETIWFD